MRPIIACVVGTRPDAIKTLPVVQRLREMPDRCECLVISTGQHREMLDQVFEAFGIGADVELGLMRDRQSLSALTSRCLEALDAVLTERKPSFLMAQGDTTTTFCASLAAFYHRIPFGHIEAGLRTYDLANPFPEEFNRRAAAIVARHHYAPTEVSAENLRREGVPDQDIFVTGNTGIDAVMLMAQKLPQTWLPDHKGRVLLLTSHRRENWGEPMRRIARAARQLVDRFPDTRMVVPMHLNPTVREALTAELGGHERIELVEPPEHPNFVKLMQRSTLILSDSGGVQEEAPAFGVPVLVLRETTERPEGVSAGVSKLVGSDPEMIVREATEFLEGRSTFKGAANPYGDGQAALRIAELVLAEIERKT